MQAMDCVLEEVVRRCDAGEPVALCTVVAARGSTPQAAGARMLLLPDGQTIGTLGGGCGVLPRAATTVQSATGSPASHRRTTSSSTQSIACIVARRRSL